MMRPWHPDVLGLMAGVVLILTTPGAASAWDVILTCRFEEETGFKIIKERVAHHRNVDSTEVVFAGLDSASPIMKGNAGESRLTVVRREADTVWLMEQPPLSGVNVYTIFRDTKRVIGSKQYRATMLDVVFALTWIGQCR
jgi:hypothetical protein